MPNKILEGFLDAAKAASLIDNDLQTLESLINDTLTNTQEKQKLLEGAKCAPEGCRWKNLQAPAPDKAHKMNNWGEIYLAVRAAEETTNRLTTKTHHKNLTENEIINVF